MTFGQRGRGVVTTITEGGRSALRRVEASRRLDDARAFSDIDLVVVTVWMAVAVVFVMLQLNPLLRLPIALPAALILPGYAIGAALFPPAELDLPERAALAFGLSMALIVVATPVLNLTAPGLAPVIVVALSAVATWLGAGAAWWRRGHRGWGGAPVRRALSSPAPIRVRRRSLAGAAAAVVVAIYLAFRLTAPATEATELFVVDSSGTIGNVPAVVSAGSPVGLRIGIASHDPPGVTYRVAVVTGGTTLAERDGITIGPDASWSDLLQFRLPPGLGQEVTVTLYRGAETTPYRMLRLKLDVLPPGVPIPSASPSGSNGAPGAAPSAGAPAQGASSAASSASP